MMRTIVKVFTQDKAGGARSVDSLSLVENVGHAA